MRITIEERFSVSEASKSSCFVSPGGDSNNATIAFWVSRIASIFSFDLASFTSFASLAFFNISDLMSWTLSDISASKFIVGCSSRFTVISSEDI